MSTANTPTDTREPVPAPDVYPAPRIMSITTGSYKSRAGNIGHVLYALDDDGQIWKNTINGWERVPGPHTYPGRDFSDGPAHNDYPPSGGPHKPDDDEAF